MQRQDKIARVLAKRRPSATAVSRTVSALADLKQKLLHLEQTRREVAGRLADGSVRSISKHSRSMTCFANSTRWPQA